MSDLALVKSMDGLQWAIFLSFLKTLEWKKTFFNRLNESVEYSGLPGNALTSHIVSSFAGNPELWMKHFKTAFEKMINKGSTSQFLIHPVDYE